MLKGEARDIILAGSSSGCCFCLLCFLVLYSVFLTHRRMHIQDADVQSLVLAACGCVGGGLVYVEQGISVCFCGCLWPAIERFPGLAATM